MLLIKEVTKPSVVLFSSLLLLILGNIISISEALNGFSNPGMLDLGMLFIVAAAIHSSSRFEDVVMYLLGKKNCKRTRYLRLMLKVSAFLLCFFWFVMVLSATLKIVPILIAPSLTAIILIMSNIISYSDAKKSVDSDVLIIIASAFGIATALINSGLSGIIGVFIVWLLYLK